VQQNAVPINFQKGAGPIHVSSPGEVRFSTKCSAP
jgi:hypothetical protein